MRKLFLGLLTVTSLLASQSFGQSENSNLTPAIDPILFHPGFSIGINGGVTFPFTDVSSGNGGKGAIVKPAFELSGSYAPLPFLSISVSVQKGMLSAGTENTELRYFENNYWSEQIMARFSPFGLVQDDTGIPHPNSFAYVGLGVALIQSNTEATLQNGFDNGSLGHYKGSDFSLPVEIGFTMPFYTTQTGSLLSANINYRHYMTFTDKIDGYNPQTEVNKHKDAYGFLSLGLSYQF